MFASVRLKARVSTTIRVARIVQSFDRGHGLNSCEITTSPRSDAGNAAGRSDFFPSAALFSSHYLVCLAFWEVFVDNVCVLLPSVGKGLSTRFDRFQSHIARILGSVPLIDSKRLWPQASVCVRSRPHTIQQCPGIRRLVHAGTRSAGSPLVGRTQRLGISRLNLLRGAGRASVVACDRPMRPLAFHGLDEITWGF